VILGEQTCCVHFAIQQRNVATENQSGMIMKAILNTVNATVRPLAVTRLPILTHIKPTRFAHVTPMKLAAQEILGQLTKSVPASPDQVNVAQVRVIQQTRTANASLQNNVALDKHGGLMSNAHAIELNNAAVGILL